MANHENQAIMCFATQGDDHLDAARLRYLMSPMRPQMFSFDHDRKIRSAARLVRAALAKRPALIVMEGTGIAGGLTLIALNVLLGMRYVVSSGDAVGPFLGLHSRLVGLLGGAYERLLCRRCAGFVGWTPYLVGRALTFGAPRGMTAAGWTRDHPAPEARTKTRARLGIPEDALVVGLVGRLVWTESVGYVYGAELARAVRRTKRADIVACIVGDGSGRQRLEAIAGDELGGRIVLPGRVPAAEVPSYLAGFDIASLSQSVDGVGSFRYSTKLSEYLAAGLPIITTQIPAAYDLDEGFFWRLPGSAPWSDAYVGALVDLFESLTHEDVASHRRCVTQTVVGSFQRHAQQRRMQAFIEDLLSSPGT